MIILTNSTGQALTNDWEPCYGFLTGCYLHSTEIPWEDAATTFYNFTNGQIRLTEIKQFVFK